MPLPEKLSSFAIVLQKVDICYDDVEPELNQASTAQIGGLATLL